LICKSCGSEFTGNFCNQCGEEVYTKHTFEHIARKKVKLVKHAIMCHTTSVLKNIENPSKEGLILYDSDKLRYDLLPPFAIEKVVKILTLGAEKYAPGNWKYVEHWKERYTAALMRHLEAYRKGESIDPESGESHLSHMLCCGIFLLEKELEESNNHEIN